MNGTNVGVSGDCCCCRLFDAGRKKEEGGRKKGGSEGVVVGFRFVFVYAARLSAGKRKKRAAISLL